METAVNTKKRLYLETLGITVYTNKHRSFSFDAEESLQAAASKIKNPDPVKQEYPVEDVLAEVEVGKNTVNNPVDNPKESPQTNSIDAAINNPSEVEQTNTQKAFLDVALVQNNAGVAVVADLTDLAEAASQWNIIQELLLDVARAATITLFGEGCDLSKAKAQRIHGSMSAGGQLKSDKASADFLHGALLGPKNKAPKMIVMLGDNAAFFTEFGEGAELFTQRLLGQALPNLLKNVEAKQALWQAIQSYRLGW